MCSANVGVGSIAVLFVIALFSFVFLVWPYCIIHRSKTQLPVCKQ